MKKAFLIAVLACFLISGCSAFPTKPETLPPPTATEQSEIPTAASQSTPTQQTATPKLGPVTLRIWLPPQFDPAAETAAAALFQARLDEFAKRRPGVNIEVRIKAQSGIGGLLDSLIAASAAAPLALPDLVVLSRDMLESAALKGLLHPLDGLSEIMEQPDWYAYARQLAQVQNSVFGLPFVGDALALFYRSGDVAVPPTDWSGSLALGAAVIFPAADPQALFTLALYQAQGGEILDPDGRPYLDAAVLSSVLAFYAEAEQAGVMPYWLSQYLSDEQAWESFLERRAGLLVSWASHYLSDPLPGVSLAPLPSPKGEHYTLATGWVWAFANPHTENQELSLELAEFLISDSFLASWTEAAGYLPTRPSALENWTDEQLQAVLSSIALSSNLYPTTDILSSLGVPLSQAVVAVLKRQSDPILAAQTAAESLTGP